MQVGVCCGFDSVHPLGDEVSWLAMVTLDLEGCSRDENIISIALV